MSKRSAPWCARPKCTATSMSTRKCSGSRWSIVFANAWVYVGHDSQTPNPGDFYSHDDRRRSPSSWSATPTASIKVLHNRCPHKGTRITGETCGNTGKFFRCPYHAWSFRTDGSLLARAAEEGLREHRLRGQPRRAGPDAGAPRPQLSRLRVRAAERRTAPSFEDFFGESLSSLDNMVDRSPAGRLEVAGGVLRYMHNCNWKMLVENQTDTCHPMVAHESSAGTAVDVWKKAPPGTPKPMAVEIFAPFMSPYEFFENMGIRVWDNGHAHTGVHTLDPRQLFRRARLFREDGRGLWRDAREGDPRREPAQHRLFPQSDGQGADPVAAPVQADLGRTARWSNPGPSGWSTRPTCCSSAR